MNNGEEENWKLVLLFHLEGPHSFAGLFLLFVFWDVFVGLVSKYLHKLQGVWRQEGGNGGLEVEESFTFKRLLEVFKGGFKWAFRAPEGGFTFRRLQEGLMGAWRRLEESFSVEEGFEEAWRELQGASRGLYFQKASTFERCRLTSKRLEGTLKRVEEGLTFKEALRGLQESLKGVSRGRFLEGLGTCKICAQSNSTRVIRLEHV